MQSTTQAVQIAIEELAKLPGIGRKTAQRLVFFLLKRSEGQIEALSRSLINLKKTVHFCEICFNITETSPCAICTSHNRNHKQICVVEEPNDVYAIERTNEYRGLYHVLGGCLSPFNAFMLIQGLETLSMRMERHVANAAAIAAFLNEHPQVEWVAYAGLAAHPQHALAQKYLPQGPGAIFTFGIKAANPRQAGKTFIESLHLFSHLANVGDARSLVIHPASTTHQQLSDAELRAGGVGPEMIRLSIGLETTEDLIWDLDQALNATA